MSTTYANLSDKQRDEIVKQYIYARNMGSTVAHATAIAAHAVILPDDKAWANSPKAAANAFSMAAGVIVLRMDGIDLH